MPDSPFKVVSVTVSLELSNASYGNGGKRFVSFRAETPAEAPATIEEALDESLRLHGAAFESATSAIVAAGEIPAAQFNQQLDVVKRRIAKLLSFRHPASE